MKRVEVKSILFTHTSYPVTHTLSVEGFQERLAPVIVIPDIESQSGILGGVVSGTVSAIVQVELAGVRSVFPAISVAFTENVCTQFPSPV